MGKFYCWRCARVLADVRKEGGEIVIKCPRCHAPNRIPEDTVRA